MAEYNAKQKRISHPVAFVVGGLVSWRDIYPCNGSLAQRGTSTKHRKTKSVPSAFTFSK